MNRTYIHFAKGEPGADGVISGNVFFLFFSNPS